MIFYHPDCDFRFSDYGIQIPIVDDRAQKVFEAVKADFPTLKYFPFNDVAALSKDDLLLAHNRTYVNRLFGSYEELELEMLKSFELVDESGNYHRYDPKNSKKNFNEALATVLKQGGVTYASTKLSLQSGFSFFLGGGMHHAMSSEGRGFCLISDIVIALRKLQKENLIKSAWVVDIDAHKGDGTAELTKDDQTIQTLSLHMKDGWPLDSGNQTDPWFIPSKIDVGIAVGEESQYLSKLKMALEEMERKFSLPDVVLVVDGSDPYEHDELPGSVMLKLTREQMFERDKMVYEFFKARKVPQSYVMAGGYGKRSWEIYTQFIKYVLSELVR